MVLQALNDVNIDTSAPFSDDPAPVEAKAIGSPRLRLPEHEFAALGEVQTIYHAKRALRRVGAANGFSAFAMLRLRTEGGTFALETITSDWSEDPAPEMKALADASPRLRGALVDATLPFHLATHGSALAAPPASSILCLPLYCERARSALLFAYDGPARPDTAFGDLHLFSLYLFAQLTLLMRPRLTATPLAPRETECLRWSAAGKTSAEIAGIIGVSENTVNSYLASAAQKMNAVNRVQTVAQAMRFGLLS